MNWNYFFISLGSFVVAYFFYRNTKGKLASEKNNWKGFTLSLYIQSWGVIIIAIILGLIFMLKSLPSQI